MADALHQLCQSAVKAYNARHSPHIMSESVVVIIDYPKRTLSLKMRLLRPDKTEPHENLLEKDEWAIKENIGAIMTMYLEKLAKPLMFGTVEFPEWYYGK